MLGGRGRCCELQKPEVEQVEGREGWEEERGTGCCDARGHETEWLGTRLGRAGD